METREIERRLADPPRQPQRTRRGIPLSLDGMRVALFLLVVINVSRIHQSVPALELLRPGLVLVVAAGAFAVLVPGKANLRDLLRATEARLILALFLLTCVSAVAGISLGNSATYILDSYSKVILAALLLLAGIRHGRDLYTLVWAFVVGSGLLALSAIFLFKLSARGGGIARLQDLNSYDSNDMGVVLLVGLPLALLFARHTLGWRKWFCLATVVATGIAMARGGSRGTLVGLVGTGAVLLVTLKTVQLWKRVAFVAVVVVALIFAAPPGYWDQMATILGVKSDYNWTSKDGRKQILIRGLGYVAYYPLTGLGIRNFQRAECMSDLSEKVRTRVRGHGIRCAAPHNTYLQVAAETGVTGLVIWILLLFGGMRRMRVVRRRIPPAWRKGDAEQRFLYDLSLYLPISMIGFAITTLFVSFAWLDILYIAVVYQAGLRVAVRKRLAQESAPPRAAVAEVRRGVPVQAALPAM